MNGQILTYNSSNNNWEFSENSVSSGLNLTTHTYFVDDFYGVELLSNWLCDIQGSNNDINFIDGVGGVIELITDGNSNFTKLNSKYKTIDKNNNCSLKFKLNINSITDINIEFGSIFDAGNLFRFINNSGNWYSETLSNSISTLNDTTVNLNTLFHLFEIKYYPSYIEFYIDGVLKTTHTTNLYNGLSSIYCKISSTTATQKKNKIDYIEFFGNR